ncbi:SDR family NAD(P)-dependent oxidoreductase [Nisaea nitritireducens]|uniref:SDR family NAD(P)-dependent oxidoreductase n=1 Tax=Nisaea nitritireducens TaxID=568392 RepID=UPI00186842D7|nr:SDR family NAD(P)-dependent oxidoreductase [Nisaea nitritireducens]
MAELVGKVAIVTGASAPRGIGRAVAMRLAAEGASVIVSDLGTSETTNLLADIVSEITAAGGTALAVTVDVTRKSDIETAVKLAREHFGRIDILVNNAGSLAGSAPFLETKPAEWETSFAVNLLGPAMFTQAVIPEMRASGGGSIVNIGSTGSLGADAGFGAYTAMKHGLVGLTKTVAAEFGVDGIRCNVVCPGFIATDMHTAANDRLARESSRPVDAVKQERYRTVAMRRAGEPEEVAEAVAFLAGPRAEYITGIAMPISGGTPVGL